MNDNLSLSKDGAELIKAFESCGAAVGGGKFKPYLCPGNVLTIGWGHTNHNGRQFVASDIWMQAHCDAAFSDDMKTFETIIRRRVRCR